MLRGARKLAMQARRRRELREAQKRRDEAGAEYRRKAVNYQRDLRVRMNQQDRRSPFERCLACFYGPEIDYVQVQHPEDIPAALGRADEFWEEWAKWDKERAEESKKIEAVKALATSKLGF